MARIRYLKPEFFEDEHLAELPFWIRLLFAGLWNIADKEGRLEDRPKRIKAKIFPYDNIDIAKGLSMLCKLKADTNRPFIIRYEINGERYIQILSWHSHQKPHHTEKDSVIPSPPKNTLKIMVNGKDKEKGDGDGECSQRELEKSNGELTDKRRLNKDKYKDYVYLTKDEYQKLIKKIGGRATEEYISRLNDYVGSVGKKYKSHYHTICNWVRKDPTVKSNTSTLLEMEKRLKDKVKDKKKDKKR